MELSKLRTNISKEFPRISTDLSKLTAASSVVFAGLGVCILYLRVPVNNFFHLLPGVNITISSMVLLPLLYLFVLTPKFARFAFWGFGLFLGLDELSFQVQRSIQFPAAEFGSLSLFGWPVYMGVVILLFAMSTYILRSRIKKGVVGLLVVFGIGFVLAVLANVYTVFAGVGTYIGYDTPRDILLAFVLVRMVKPVPKELN